MTDKCLIIGSGGQLGRALQKHYVDADVVDSDVLDIGNLASINEFDFSPYSLIINAAAWTNVDGAELGENRPIAWKVNAHGPAYIAQKARQYQSVLIHVSSDYVFDGSQKEYTEDAQFSPLSVYGASKAAGDLAVAMHEKHYIIRTSWVIGEGNNFVRAMMNLATNGVSPNVVNDQIGRLTFASELVRAIDHLIRKQCQYGTYNVSGSGDAVSWQDIAQEVFRRMDRNPLDVSGISTENYYRGKDHIAQRPRNSYLDLRKIEASGLTLQDWRESLVDYIQEEGEA